MTKEEKIQEQVRLALEAREIYPLALSIHINLEMEVS